VNNIITVTLCSIIPHVSAIREDEGNEREQKQNRKGVTCEIKFTIILLSAIPCIFT